LNVALVTTAPAVFKGEKERKKERKGKKSCFPYQRRKGGTPPTISRYPSIFQRRGPFETE